MFRHLLTMLATAFGVRSRAPFHPPAPPRREVPAGLPRRRRRYRPWRKRTRAKRVPKVVEKRPEFFTPDGIGHDWYRPIALKPTGPCFPKGVWR